MKPYELIFLNIFFLITASSSKILGVVEIIRHGSRAPKSFAQNGQKYFFDSSNMILTINGFRQHYLLGKWLQERYIDSFKLLPTKFNKNDFRLYSSATQRTVFSLTGHMLGLYSNVNIIPEYNQINNLKFNQSPPINRFKINEDDRNKIKVTVKNRVDPIFHIWKCKLEGKKLISIGTKKNIYNFNDETYDSMISTFKKHLPFIFNKNKLISNLAKKKIVLVKKLIGYVVAVKFVTHDEIFNFSKDFNHLMRIFILNKWYNYRLNENNQEIVRLAASGFFSELKNYLINKFKGNDTKKFLIFSGHDTNLIDILSNLIDHKHLKILVERVIQKDDNQAFSFLVPKFASNILFELHQNKRKVFYVRIIYNGIEIKQNFISKKLKYEANHGIIMKNFIEFLTERINGNLKKLIC